MKRKPEPDPTPKAKPVGEFWRGEGNRKPTMSPMDLPRNSFKTTKNSVCSTVHWLRTN